MAKKVTEKPADLVQEQEAKVVEAAEPRKEERKPQSKRKAISGHSSSKNQTVSGRHARGTVGKTADGPQEYLERTKMAKDMRKANNRAEGIRMARTRAFMRGAAQEARETFFGAWGSMTSAMNTKTILHARIASIESFHVPAMNNLPAFNSVMAVVFVNGLKVLIPFDELFRDPAIEEGTVDMTTPDGVRRYYLRQKAMASKLYGSEIPFLVTEMKLDDQLEVDCNYTIVASRREALRFVEEHNFGSKTKEARYHVGDFMAARVLAIGSNGCSLFANVGGIDTVITVYNLTYRYVESGDNSLQKYYKVGDTIRVQLTSIKERKDGTHEIKVSGKPAELEDAKKAQHLLPVGTETTGTITLIHPSRQYPGKVIVNMFLDAYGIPAFSHTIPAPKSGMTPRSGDTVRVRVMKFLDNGMASCKLEGFHGNQNFTFKI